MTPEQNGVLTIQIVCFVYMCTSTTGRLVWRLPRVRGCQCSPSWSRQGTGESFATSWSCARVRYNDIKALRYDTHPHIANRRARTTEGMKETLAAMLLPAAATTPDAPDAMPDAATPRRHRYHHHHHHNGGGDAEDPRTDFRPDGRA